MIKATAKLSSLSPYSQSRHYDTPKEAKEIPKDYEKRTWRERCHADESGKLYIPAMAFKNSISEAAKFLGIQIPGKGKSTYTKHFEAGVMVLEHVPLPIQKDAVESEWVFVPADGIRGSGKRVDKCFPVVPEWAATVEFWILDHTITRDVFEQHLNAAGGFIGIGRWRPRNNGMYGRFKVEKLDWEVQD